MNSIQFLFYSFVRFILFLCRFDLVTFRRKFTEKIQVFMLRLMRDFTNYRFVRFLRFDLSSPCVVGDGRECNTSNHKN